MRWEGINQYIKSIFLFIINSMSFLFWDSRTYAYLYYSSKDTDY